MFFFDFVLVLWFVLFFFFSFSRLIFFFLVFFFESQMFSLHASPRVLAVGVFVLTDATQPRHRPPTVF